MCNFFNSGYSNIVDNIVKKENATKYLWHKKLSFNSLYFMLSLLAIFKTTKLRVDKKKDKIAFSLMTDRTTYKVYNHIVNNIEKDFIFLGLSKKYTSDKYSKQTKKEFSKKIFFFSYWEFLKSFFKLNFYDIAQFINNVPTLKNLDNYQKGRIFITIIYWQYIIDKNRFSTFITFNDTLASPVTHLVFNANQITMIHLQNGEREYRNKSSFNSYDYLLAFGENVINEYYKNDLKSYIKNPIVYGSFLMNKILQNEEKESIDICFVEQLAPFDVKTSFIQNDYLKAVENLVKFNQENRYKITYCVRADIRKNMPLNYIHFIKKIDELLVASSIEVSYDDIYTELAKSKLIITYNSTVGLESIGLGKRVLFCNYSKFDFGILKPSETFYSIINPEYDIFRHKVNDVVLSENYKSKMKELQLSYMYPNKNYLRVLKEIIV